MLIKVGLENGIEGRSLAWAIDFPGCFAYGSDGPEALMSIPRALLAYHAWLDRHTPDSWLKDLGDFDVRLVDVWQVYYLDEQYEPAEQGREINAWFQSDWMPLSRLEVQRGAAMLQWSRQDLLDTAQPLGDARLDQPISGEKRTLRGILTHVANAEWWYLDQFKLAGMAYTSLPKDDVFARLRIVRQQTQAVLAEMPGREQVTGVGGELWSPRKLLRRLLWHEQDHIEHIRKLLVSGAV
ncbi:MAG: DinB family protein [Chloroflexi bacterium]|nr:DinB family protein [Chloroflexota bacterium]